MTAINSNRAIRGPVTAVPVVAGKGVRLVADTENNRWVVEADETVLWDGGTAGTSGDITLSESVDNFEKIAIFFNIAKSFEEGTYLYAGNWQHFRGDDLTAVKKFCVSGNTNNGNSDNTLVFKNQSYSVSSDGKTLTYLRTTQVYFNGSSWSVATTNKFYIYKVVGINRVSGGN